MFGACQGKAIVSHMQRRGSGPEKWEWHVFRTVEQRKCNGFRIASESKQKPLPTLLIMIGVWKQ